MSYIIGPDLGQSQDYTTICVLEMGESDESTIYHVRTFERMRGVSYPAIISRVANIMKSPALEGNAGLVIENRGWNGSL